MGTQYGGAVHAADGFNGNAPSADAIQQKKFPSFVAISPADSFYHVQVGPYPDMPSAENAKRALEQLGFKPIIKH
jgi:cell division septation protein DedD